LNCTGVAKKLQLGTWQPARYHVENIAVKGFQHMLMTVVKLDALCTGETDFEAREISSMNAKHMNMCLHLKLSSFHVDISSFVHCMLFGTIVVHCWLVHVHRVIFHSLLQVS